MLRDIFVLFQQIFVYIFKNFFVCGISERLFDYLFWNTNSAYSFHQTTVEQAENLIRQHEVFITTLDANDDKINNVLNMGQRLINENNYMSKSVQQKIESLKERSVP